MELEQLQLKLNFGCSSLTLMGASDRREAQREGGAETRESPGENIQVKTGELKFGSKFVKRLTCDLGVSSLRAGLWVLPIARSIA